jgi:hypothetical protein
MNSGQVTSNLAVLAFLLLALRSEWRAWRTADAVSTYPEAWTPRKRLLFRGARWATILAAIVFCIATISEYAGCDTRSSIMGSSGSILREN